MVQILPQLTPKRNIWGEIGAGLGTGFGEGLKERRLAEMTKGMEDLQHRRAKELINLKGEQQQNLQSLKSGESIEDQKRTDIIRMNFGDRAAQLYAAAPEGGKTSIINSLLEARQRGLNIEDLLGPLDQEVNPTLETAASKRPIQETERIEKPSIKAIDYDKGLTPKERVKRQEERYSKNLPLYQATQQKIQSLESEDDSLNILSELSPQIIGWQKLNINPSTGELIIPGLASPEAQRFVKTVNDFTTKAKDSYGARISNFELDRFMKRLPTLANSVEGRSQIIRQMQIINRINLARENSLEHVINEHGGIRNIDFDQAERLANNQSKGEIASLKKEFNSIDSNLDSMYKNNIDEKKKDLVPPGRILIEKDGKHFSVPQNQLKKALSKGYKRA